MVPCGDLLDFSDSTPVIVIQEQYSTVFDFNAQTCLNLTYHEHGETRERGAALANFRQLYKNEGYEQSNSELPDYLPLGVCRIQKRNHPQIPTGFFIKLPQWTDSYLLIVEQAQIRT
jgi:nitrate reductase assembly molybdenum cofactor insertion protein NarJ